VDDVLQENSSFPIRSGFNRNDVINVVAAEAPFWNQTNPASVNEKLASKSSELVFMQ
jgi:hypothetical protein